VARKFKIKDLKTIILKKHVLSLGLKTPSLLRLQLER